MPVFDVVVIAAAFCGIAMVLGGIFLLARGAITLAATPHASALSIEFRRQFRISTQVPGVAFFLIGLLFIGIALYVVKPPEVTPFHLSGVVSGVDAPVTVVATSTRWPVNTFTGGKINGKFYPDMSILIVEATAPGYLPLTMPVEIKAKENRSQDIGTIHMEKQVAEILAKKENIRPLDFAPPSVEHRGSFGAPQ